MFHKPPADYGVENLDNTTKELAKVDLHNIYSCCQKLFDLLEEPKYRKMHLLQLSYHLSEDHPKLKAFMQKNAGLWRGILTREITRNNFGHVEALLAQRSKMQYDENITVREMDKQVMQGIHQRREMMMNPPSDSDDDDENEKTNSA